MADLTLRCSALARANGYRPAGSAGSAACFVLVETPLPWPADVADHPLLAPVAPLVVAHGGRLQALVGAEPAPPGQQRVIVYRRPAGPFTQFSRREQVVPEAGLVDAVRALLDQPDGADAGAGAGAGAGGNGGRATAGPSGGNGGQHTTGPSGGNDGHATAGPEGGSGERRATAGGTGTAAPGNGDDTPVVADVLVCTHGRRDACCGRDGTRTWLELTARALPGVRVWRTSHTGGHRFAPTALTFPDGRAWASVDAEMLAGIVTRAAAAEVAAGRDRGCTAFAEPHVQAADSAVLGAEGWGWLDRARHAESTPLGNGRHLVTLTGVATGTGPVVYRAEVAVTRVVPVPDCGRPLDEARKSAPELEVVSLDRVGADLAAG